MAPATITVTGSASDSDGSIAAVEFYAGSALIGTDTSSPYSLSWSNVPEGTYELRLIARDNSGATTTSAPRAITVTPPLRWAVFNPSSDHDSAVTSYLLQIFVAGANPDTASPAASQDLGKPAVTNGECRSNIEQLIAGLQGGTYFATVSAVGPGGSARGAPSAQFSR
jgi:hypothetical protein